MKLEDGKKISSIVHTADNIEEASRLLRNSLGPMGKAGFSLEELKPFDEKVGSIRAELSQLQEELFAKIYK